MRLPFGFDIEFGRGCQGCERLERDLANLRIQNKMLADNQIHLIDTIQELRAEKKLRTEEAKKSAEFLVGLADLQRVNG